MMCFLWSIFASFKASLSLDSSQMTRWSLLVLYLPQSRNTTTVWLQVLPRSAWVAGNDSCDQSPYWCWVDGLTQGLLGVKPAVLDDITIVDNSLRFSTCFPHLPHLNLSEIIRFLRVIADTICKAFRQAYCSVHDAHDVGSFLISREDLCQKKTQAEWGTPDLVHMWKDFCVDGDRLLSTTSHRNWARLLNIEDAINRYIAMNSVVSKESHWHSTVFRVPA